jgi:hypothetical protein
MDFSSLNKCDKEEETSSRSWTRTTIAFPCRVPSRPSRSIRQFMNPFDDASTEEYFETPLPPWV